MEHWTVVSAVRNITDRMEFLEKPSVSFGIICVMKTPEPFQFIKAPN